MLSLLQHGGVAMYVLLLGSIGMVAVIIERVIRLREANTDTIIFLAKLSRLVQEGRLADAQTMCERSSAAVASVAGAGLAREGRSKEEVRDTLASAITLQQHRLSRNLAVLGTIASTAPFVGLFGTVLGIMATFRSISMAAAGSVPDVSRGISEALIATAGGLGVAILATFAYNYFQTWVQRFDVDFEVVATEVLSLVSGERERVA
jgi:biopolymer transport protein ExbB/TolQ